MVKCVKKGVFLMITFISRKLTDFLCRKSVIDSGKSEIYQYGYEVLISGLAGILIALIIGIISGRISDAVIFLVYFIPLRQLCGGYHADSYLKCNIVFTGVFSSILIFSYFFPKKLSVAAVIICCAFTFISMLLFSPVENPNKPLDSEQIAKNRRKCLIITPILSAISLAAVFFYPVYALTASTTLFSIAVLMIIPKIKDRLKDNKKAV